MERRIEINIINIDNIDNIDGEIIIKILEEMII